MSDPVILAIIVCAILAMSYALLPQITGNAEWLKDRRSELAAAIVSACLMAVAFTLKQPEPEPKPEPAERVVHVPGPVRIIEVEPSPAALAKGYQFVRDQYRREHEGGLNVSSVRPRTNDADVRAVEP